MKTLEEQAHIHLRLNTILAHINTMQYICNNNEFLKGTSIESDIGTLFDKVFAYTLLNEPDWENYERKTH